MKKLTLTPYTFITNIRPDETVSSLTVKHEDGRRVNFKYQNEFRADNNHVVPYNTLLDTYIYMERIRTGKGSADDLDEFLEYAYQYAYQYAGISSDRSYSKPVKPVMDQLKEILVIYRECKRAYVEFSKVFTEDELYAMNELLSDYGN